MITEIQHQGLAAFVNFGFTLYCPDDHTLVLLHEGRSIAIFSQLGATPESLQAECARHLVIKHGWNGCLWSRENDKAS